MMHAENHVLRPALAVPADLELEDWGHNRQWLEVWLKKYAMPARLALAYIQ
jgi:hypothetical protein